MTRGGTQKVTGTHVSTNRVHHPVRQPDPSDDSDKADTLVGRRRRVRSQPSGRDYAKKNEKQSYARWLARVRDFVSGMTDAYAMRISRRIEGA